MVEMQAKIEEERRALEAKLDMEEEERNKARAELEKREKDLQKAQSVPCIPTNAKLTLLRLMAPSSPIIQCCEKAFAPFPISSIFAYFAHLNVSDHQTHFNIRQR